MKGSYRKNEVFMVIPVFPPEYNLFKAGLVISKKDVQKIEKSPNGKPGLGTWNYLQKRMKMFVLIYFKNSLSNNFRNSSKVF